MTADIVRVRAEWEHGHARLVEEARDPAAADRLYRQVDAVLDELRKRVGATFTLGELSDAYAESERWVREAVADRVSAPGWPRTLSIVGDAAFHIYSRGAADYSP